MGFVKEELLSGEMPLRSGNVHLADSADFLSTQSLGFTASSGANERYPHQETQERRGFSIVRTFLTALVSRVSLLSSWWLRRRHSVGFILLIKLTTQRIARVQRLHFSLFLQLAAL